MSDEDQWPIGILNCKVMSAKSNRGEDSIDLLSLKVKAANEIRHRRIQTVDSRLDPDVGVIAITHYSWLKSFSGLSLEKPG